MEQMPIWFIICAIFVFVGGLSLMPKGLVGMIGKEENDWLVVFSSKIFFI